MNDDRPPAGPRGRVGASAEDAATAYLRALGWAILARNVRVERDELDVVALDLSPDLSADPGVVVVEVRSRSGHRFGTPAESMDAAKVARLYRAAARLVRSGRLPLAAGAAARAWRVDLVCLERGPGPGWHVTTHLRGLEPP